MPGRRLPIAVLALTLACLSLAGLHPGRARAANVVEMLADGHTREVRDRFISSADSIGPAAGLAPSGAVALSSPLGSRLGVSPVLTGTGRGARALRPAALTRSSRPHAPAVTVPRVLAQLAASHQITSGAYIADRRNWYGALTEERQLSHARAAQLGSVTEMLHAMAVAGKLTASRLPVLFLTLARNAQYWKSGAMLGYGQRVMFQGSELEWEYYTGEGIQLQVLGTFGEANGFYEAGASTYPDLVSLMSEMIPLAVQRDGGIAWEYYFDWEGGSPPWVSAMAQGTALEALANAYRATKNASYLAVAHSALGILATPPPTGVAVPTGTGTTFLQYSFAPHTDIINAFLQTLIGLYDYGTLAGDSTAEAMFNRGTAQAQSVLGSFNTGAWSLYQPGESDDLNYHVLVTGFLQTLCGLVKTPIYCSTYQAFEADLHTPPVITQVTQRERGATQGKRLYFELDKPAHVGVVLSDADGRTYLYTSANCLPGDDYWILPKLGAGTYSVKLSGTDLAGNYATTTGSLSVS